MFKGLHFRLSLRKKVLSIFLICVVVVLALSNYLFYLSTKSILLKNAEKQNQILSGEINAQIQESQQGQQFVDHLIGQELRIAALVAKYALNPDAAYVTNQQLVNLAHEIGIQDITLMQPTQNDIVGVKSSDPHEINLSTKSWQGWYEAFQELLKNKDVTSSYGESGPNYWTGPFANAASNPKVVDKWGYFYDGSTNYIIDPYVRDETIKDYARNSGPDAIIKDIMAAGSSVLDITGFNPNAFGKKPIVYNTGGSSWVDVKNTPVMFGAYRYQDGSRDVAAVDEANQAKQLTTYTAILNGRKVLKTFVPMTVGNVPYVIGFVTDYGTIDAVLETQLRNSLWISLLLLMVVVAISFFVSGYIVKPLVKIREKVDQIADIQFDTPVAVRRNDEIGDLATRVNVMSRNLLEYTHDLRESAIHDRNASISYLGVITSGLIHELRNPVSALRNFLELFPAQQLDSQGQAIMNHMKLASDHVNSVVNEFSDFIKQGKLNIGLHNLVDVIQEAIDLIRPHVDRVGIQLHFENAAKTDVLLASIDPDKIRQVLLNLLKNAIDAIDNDATSRLVRVELQATLNAIQIDVADTGHGIPKECWESIFVPFNSTKKSGFGLGLALCNYIVLSNGGSIRVAQSSLAGTTMRVTLPFPASLKDESDIEAV